MIARPFCHGQASTKAHKRGDHSCAVDNSALDRDHFPLADHDNIPHLQISEGRLDPHPSRHDPDGRGFGTVDLSEELSIALFQSDQEELVEVTDPLGEEMQVVIEPVDERSQEVMLRGEGANDESRPEGRGVYPAFLEEGNIGPFKHWERSIDVQGHASQAQWRIDDSARHG